MAADGTALMFSKSVIEAVVAKRVSAGDGERPLEDHHAYGANNLLNLIFH